MDGANTQTGSVAETFLRALKRRGVDYVLANAGTDFAPVIEALVALAGRGEPMPQFLTIPHENLAVAMAHGYYQMAGKPAGVMVHVTVGTGNTVCALMNAARDNVPLLLMAGRTPHHPGRPHRVALGADPLGPGKLRPGRHGPRIHEVGLRATRRPARGPVLGRALDVALTSRAGRSISRCRARCSRISSAAATSVAADARLPAPQPSAAHIGRSRGSWRAAEWPMILTSNFGRDRAAVHVLGALAERHAIPVAEPHPSCVNLPASHPFHLGHAGIELLGKADLIIVADCEVPWFPRYFTPRPNAQVVHLGVDPLWSRYPLRAFPAQLAFRARLAPRSRSRRRAAHETARPRPRSSGAAAADEFKARRCARWPRHRARARRQTDSLRARRGLPRAALPAGRPRGRARRIADSSRWKSPAACSA